MEVEIVKHLSPSSFYLVYSLEKKIKEFEEVNLSDLQRQLQAVEQQRQLLVSNINQVQGAIIGGRIMIDEEFNRFGVTKEAYEEQKAEFLSSATEQEKEYETNETASDDADRGNAG